MKKKRIVELLIDETEEIHGIQAISLVAILQLKGDGLL